jgi:hypothetical protein
MAVKKAACPNCGEVANITVNSKDDTIKKVYYKEHVAGVSRSNAYQSACSECGKKFYYWLK